MKRMPDLAHEEEENDEEDVSEEKEGLYRYCMVYRCGRYGRRYGRRYRSFGVFGIDTDDRLMIHDIYTSDVQVPPATFLNAPIHDRSIDI